MTDQEQSDLLAALRASNDERAARLRRGGRWLAAALGCFAVFLALVLLAICTNRFPWWQLTIAVVFEAATFGCLHFSRRTR